MESLLHPFSRAGVLSRRAARRDQLTAEINRLLTLEPLVLRLQLGDRGVLAGQPGLGG